MTEPAPSSSPTQRRELPPGFMLAKGAHSTPGEGMCFREAARWIAGETHSDSVPDCMCPVLATLGMRLNDRFDDEERQLLLPLLERCIGTRSTIEVERRRAYSVIDASIREIVPMGLEAVKWTDLAAKLRAIAPIVDTASARAAQAITMSVRDEARKRKSADYADYADAAAADYAADAAAADYAADAAADAAAAAAYAAYDAAAAAKTPVERARLRLQARLPIVLASIAAFERAIAITE